MWFSPGAVVLVNILISNIVVYCLKHYAFTELKKIFSFKYILNQKEINWKKGGGGAGKWALGVLDPTSQVFLTMKFGLQCLLWEICEDRIDRREAVMAADLYTLSDLSQIARGRLMEIHNSQQTTILVALYWNKLQDSAILRRRQLPNC